MAAQSEHTTRRRLLRRKDNRQHSRFFSRRYLIRTLNRLSTIPAF